MKYRILLSFLRALMMIKRFFWLIGRGLGVLLGWIFKPIFSLFALVSYKISYFLKKTGLSGQGSWVFKRDNLQLILLAVVFILVIPQSKVFTKTDPNLFGRKTIAYRVFSEESEDFSLEEVSMSPVMDVNQSEWRQGALSNDLGSGLAGDIYVHDHELGSVVAGGMAITKPNLMIGETAGGARSSVVDYEVQTGDSLSSIAYQFDVSVATVMWENRLTLRSMLKVGQKLSIPPTSGVMHIVKKGDNVKKIAALYNAKSEDIIKFNKLDNDNSGLKIGSKIMVPDGVMPQDNIVTRVPRISQTLSHRAAPAGSTAAPSLSGFVWPSGVHTITQYYNWKHHALDIAGPWQTPNYAAKSGTVEVSQCGWNHGYGCYIIINHGNGVKTLYGHNSELLVSPGDYVTAGQTIGLMGNTGNVRGRTGIHLHFEIIVNNARVNPLGYVR